MYIYTLHVLHYNYTLAVTKGVILITIKYLSVFKVPPPLSVMMLSYRQLRTKHEHIYLLIHTLE